MQAGQVLATALAAIGFVAAAFASLHALLNKRRPQSAFGWIAICLTLPLLGALLYYLFGINRVQTRARKLLTRHPAPECPTEYVGTPPPQLAAAGAARLRRQRLAADGREPHRAAARRRRDLRRDDRRHRSGTRVRLFQHLHLRRRPARANGLPQRSPPPRSAAPTCACCSTASASGTRGTRASSLFRGTRVRFARFLPPRLWPPTINVNLRNHRKILVVDGRRSLHGRHQRPRPVSRRARRRAHRRLALSLARPGARADRDRVPARLAVRDRRRDCRGAARAAARGHGGVPRRRGRTRHRDSTA